MPNARDHSVITIVGAISGGASASPFVDMRLAAIAAAAAVLGDLLLSSDLDHDKGCLAYRLWGPLRFIWYPYKEMLPHRSPISHWPILGTVGRLTYLCGTSIIGAHFAGADMAAVLTAYWPEITAGVVGLEVANTLHFLADRLA